MLQNTERNRLADLLKGIAILLMIQVHIMELFASQDIFHSTIGKVSLFLGAAPAAPIFMIVMGYFAAQSKRDFDTQLLRGIKLFLGGILLNVGLNLSLLIKIYFYGENLDPYRYIFGADILPLAGLSLIALAGIKKFTADKSIWQVIILVFVILIAEVVNKIDPLIPDTWKYFLSFLFGISEWAYFPFFIWFVYPLSGFLLYNLLLRQVFTKYFKKRNLLIGFILVAIFTALTINWSTSLSANLQAYYHHGFLFYVWCIIFLTGWTIAIHFILSFLQNNYVIRYAEWLGRNVTAVYVFQWIIIGNIATYIYQSKGIWEIVLWFPFVLLITSILTLLWRKYQT